MRIINTIVIMIKYFVTLCDILFVHKEHKGLHKGHEGIQ